MKAFRDNKATYDYSIETAREEGKSEGINEGILIVAKSLKETGLSTALIVKTTGLTALEIEKL